MLKREFTHTNLAWFCLTWRAKTQWAKERENPPLNISIKSFTSKLLGPFKWSSPSLSWSITQMERPPKKGTYYTLQWTWKQSNLDFQSSCCSRSKHKLTELVCTACVTAKNDSSSSISTTMTWCLAQQGRWNFNYRHSYLPPEVEAIIVLLQPIKSNSYYIRHNNAKSKLRHFWGSNEQEILMFRLHSLI